MDAHNSDNHMLGPNQDLDRISIIHNINMQAAHQH